MANNATNASHLFEYRIDLGNLKETGVLSIIRKLPSIEDFDCAFFYTQWDSNQRITLPLTTTFSFFTDTPTPNSTDQKPVRSFNYVFDGARNIFISDTNPTTGTTILPATFFAGVKNHVLDYLWYSFRNTNLSGIDSEIFTNQQGIANMVGIFEKCKNLPLSQAVAALGKITSGTIVGIGRACYGVGTQVSDDAVDDTALKQLI